MTRPIVITGFMGCGKSKIASATPLSVYMEVGYSPAPPYAFGAGSFGDEVIKLAGGTNIFGTETSGGGYPAVSEERISTLGTFSSVSVGLEDAENPQKQKRAVITVAELPSQYLEQRPGFSTGDGKAPTTLPRELGPTAARLQATRPDHRARTGPTAAHAQRRTDGHRRRPRGRQLGNGRGSPAHHQAHRLRPRSRPRGGPAHGALLRPRGPSARRDRKMT